MFKLLKLYRFFVPNLTVISYGGGSSSSSANLTPEHAVLVLVSSANHCQAKGVFNLDEAELIAKAIKTLSKPQPNVEQSK
jgi:hypothetical protein